jgi:hypothetical protein
MLLSRIPQVTYDGSLTGERSKNLFKENSMKSRFLKLMLASALLLSTCVTPIVAFAADGVGPGPDVATAPGDGVGPGPDIVVVLLSLINPL